jgi:SH3 domain-containing YSC84-like protein 1
VRRTAYGWSDPAFLSFRTVYLRPQGGGAGGETVMLLMTDEALNDLIKANKLSLSANTGLTIVDYSAKGEAPVGKGDIVIWSNELGAFAGGSVSATDIVANTQEDHSFYGKSATTERILDGTVPHEAAAHPLISALRT